MRTKFTVITLIIISFLQLSAQNKNDFGISFKGFVKTDVMFDSRQVVTAREGHFLFFPQPENLDVDGKDINSQPNFNMLSVQTRLTGNITAPDAFGAKVSGMVEGAFFGHSDGDINGFRLRHAFVKLDWENSSLLIGQFWHPMFQADDFPGVVSFNTGVPFQPFSRNPQIRFTQKADALHFIFTAFTQRDFTSTGPNGASSIYLRNAAMPMLNLTMKYSTKDFLIGGGVDYKKLNPLIETNKDYKNDETISSISFMGFTKYTSDDFTFKLEGIVAENATDLLMLGGYAVKSTDAVTGISEYTNIKTLSLWTDISFGTALQFGIFGGYTKNLGSSDDITGSIFSRGGNIANVMRISPRILYSMGKVTFASEIEYTSAAYGVTQPNGTVEDTKNVSNLRILFSSFLYF